MRTSKIVHYLLPLLLLAFLLGNISVEAAANSDDTIEPSSLLLNFLKRGVESVTFNVSILSYKPQLEQFTQLLNTLGSPGIDAALMPSVSIILTHTTELSSQLEIGYWTNNTELPPPNAADLSATLIPISLNLVYRPLLLREFIPLYLGGGIGFSHLSVDGSALDLIEQQGITVDAKNSGLTGYALIGLKYPILGDELSIVVEAKQIFKTFMASETPPLELDFDGTAIGVGIRLKF